MIPDRNNTSFRSAGLWVIFGVIISLCSYAVLQSQDRKFFKTLSEDPTAFFTMLLAIFTIVLAIVTLLIWRDSREEFARQRFIANEQARNADKSLQISRKMLESAEASAQSVKDNAQIEIRAYLDVEMVSLHLQKVPDHPDLLTARFKISNTGKTPARHVRHIFHLRVLKWPLESEDDVIAPDQRESKLESLAAVQASQSLVVSGAHGLDVNRELERIHNKKLYAIANTTYIDVFGHTRETKFCGFVVETESLLRRFLENPEGGSQDTPIDLERSRYGNTPD